MNEPRYASLSGSLLARKGGARPAMRPLHGGMDDLGWNDMGFDPGQSPSAPSPSSITALTPAPRPILAEKPVVLEQQQEIEESFAHELEAPVEAAFEAPVFEAAAEPVEDEPEAYAAPVAEIVRLPRRAPGTTGRKAAFTLRLDGDRHLRLRLATAVTGRSAQQLVTAALDQFLESIPEVANLAQHVPVLTGRNA